MKSWKINDNNIRLHRTWPFGLLSRLWLLGNLGKVDQENGNNQFLSSFFWSLDKYVILKSCLLHTEIFSKRRKIYSWLNRRHEWLIASIIFYANISNSWMINWPKDILLISIIGQRIIFISKEKVTTCLLYYLFENILPLVGDATLEKMTSLAIGNVS